MQENSPPPPFSIWRGLTIQLFAVTVLPLTVLLLVIAFGSLSLHHHAMRSLVGSRDLRAAQAAANTVAQELENRLELLESLALQTTPDDNLQAFLHISPILMNSFEGGAAVFSKEGKLLASTDPVFWEDPQVLNVLPAFRSDGGTSSSFSAPFTVQGSAENRLIAVYTGSQGQVAAGSFDPAHLAGSVLKSLTQEEKLSIMLIDEQGQTLFQAGPELAAENIQQGLRSARAAEQGIFFSGSGASEMVIAYSVLQTGRWLLMLQEPWQAASSPLLLTTQLAPLILVPVLLLALLALAFIARQIIQPLQALWRQTQELSRGRYQAIEKPVGGIAEIQHLQQELSRMSQRVQAAQESLHSYIGAITTAQEEERRRLARDLHDDTLQALIALNQRLQLSQQALNGHPASASLEEIQGLTAQTMENLRRLTRALRPIYLEDLGLAASLEILSQESSRSLGIPVHFQTTGAERRLSPEAELALYRMAQEALSNIARHAQAKHASLQLNYLPESTNLMIADDGRGFEVPDSPALFARQGHFGLLGLHERAELISASLTIRSTPGEGTFISIRLPARDNPSG